MIYQHPLAYLIGVEGAALLRGWAGEYDREVVEARLAEVRRLLNNAELVNHPGVEVRRRDIEIGYRDWSATYDDGRNSLFDYDEPCVFGIVDELPVGTALDAACGTGRYAAHLAAAGHQLIGVDASPEMLARARTRVPGADFRHGDVRHLPVGNDEVDLVVAGLALTHVPDLDPVLAEFARVLRPGGHVVIADVHADLIKLGSVPVAIGRDGEPGLTAAYPHETGDYIRAALRAGLQVRGCEETRLVGTNPQRPAQPDASVKPWETWPWTLMDMVPAAVRSFSGPGGVRQTIIWHFQL